MTLISDTCRPKSYFKTC